MKAKDKKPKADVEALFAAFEALAEAACDYHGDASYKNSEILRDAAVEYATIVKQLEGKS